MKNSLGVNLRQKFTNKLSSKGASLAPVQQRKRISHLSDPLPFLYKNYFDVHRKQEFNYMSNDHERLHISLWHVNYSLK